MNALFSFAGLTVRAGERSLLTALSGELGAGARVGVIGPNGSGKSTLLRALAAAHGAHDRLRVSFRAWSYRGVESAGPLTRLTRQELASRVVYVGARIQDVLGLSLSQWLSLVPGSAEGVERELERFGLGTRSRARLSELSAGEQQRALLARAWLRRPRVLLLDETLSQLDLDHQRRALESIREWVVETQGSVMWVSHDLRLARAWSDQLWVLKDGRWLTQSPGQDALSATLLEQLYPQASSAAVRELIDGVLPTGAGFTR